MRWIRTWSDAAQMVDFQASRDGADQHFVRKAMSADDLAVAPVESAISLLGSSSPEPAGGEVGTAFGDGAIFVDESPEVLGVWSVPLPLRSTEASAKASSAFWDLGVTWATKYKGFVTAFANAGVFSHVVTLASCMVANKTCTLAPAGVTAVNISEVDV